MNIDRIKQLRDFMATLPPERIRMDRFISVIAKDNPDIEDDVDDDLYLKGAKTALDRHPCGTCACIAGWANYLFAPNEPQPCTTTARRALDLTYQQDSALFTPAGWETDPPSPAQVLATLDHLIETGEVRW